MSTCCFDDLHDAGNHAAAFAKSMDTVSVEFVIHSLVAWLMQMLQCGAAKARSRVRVAAFVNLESVVAYFAVPDTAANAQCA